MRFSADGKFIYLLNELDLSVTTFAWNEKEKEQPSVSPPLPRSVKK